jgi:hypothetical protein
MRRFQGRKRFLRQGRKRLGEIWLGKNQILGVYSGYLRWLNLMGYPGFI